MRTDNQKSKSLGEALFPKTKRDLLTLFFLNPNKSFYLREIVKILNTSPGAVNRELNNLVSADILLTELTKNRRYFKVNIECFIYTEIKNIIVKTFGVVDIIKSALTSVENKLQLALIYGSVARQEDTGRSDIDLLVVGDVTFKEIAILLSSIEDTLHRPVNPSVYSKNEFNNKYTSDNHFIKSVFDSETILLFGKLDDTSKLV